MRLKLLFTVNIFIFALIIARLFYWQVVKASDLKIQAKRQYETGFSDVGKRGEIYASDESLLVSNRKKWLVFAEITKIESDKRKLADSLAKILEDDSNRIYELLNKKDLVWVPLKNKIDAVQKKNIEDLKEIGLGFEEVEERLYLEGSTAAHALGFVGKNEKGDDIGYFGLEGFYDYELKGKIGYQKSDADATGKKILAGENFEFNTENGVSLVTYFDKGIQIFAEKKLEAGVSRYGAKSGSVIILNPKTGGIIAMANYPKFDPQTYNQFDNYLFKNPIISDTFEPGSVFKVIVMAAALDAGVVESDTICDICDKPYKVDKYYINTWNNEYNANSTMTEVIVHSDNVGMVFAGSKLGRHELFQYIKNFGFFEKTGVDLQGEVKPYNKQENKLNIVDEATWTFGQGISVTPIQLVTAVSAIANKGVLLKPSVTKEMIFGKNKVDVKPEMVRKVISEDASNKITQMMAEAAKNGEAKWTYKKGFKVAGKTGTAQIPIEGHYDKDKTIASFVGFAPYNDPKFVMLVTLREPQTSQWASETAAPLWYNIAEDLFLRFKIQPE